MIEPANTNGAGFYGAFEAAPGNWDLPTVHPLPTGWGSPPSHPTADAALAYVRPLIGRTHGGRIAALRHVADGVDRRDELTWPHALRVAPRRLGPAYDPPRSDALGEAADACGMVVVLTRSLSAHRRRLFEIAAEEAVAPGPRKKATP